MQSLLISAPFGNYIRRSYATSILGTYTLAPRAGFVKRWWRVLCTLRYNRHTGGWVNKLGLPNPGLKGLAERVAWGLDVSRDIISVFGFSRDEWTEIVASAASLRPLAVELNLSCPNVGHSALVSEVGQAIAAGFGCGLTTIIAKLPPVRWMELARPLYALGIRHFHLCNTMPVAGGALSGKPLKQYSLWAVAEVRQTWGNEVDITGGGGITGVEDVYDYIKAGANRVSVASMLLNPLNYCKLESIARASKTYCGGV
jgi:dihydroorotate dehydrogenase